MKVSKRILALLLAVILSFSAVAVSASAAGVTAEIDEDGKSNNGVSTATVVEDIAVGAKGALVNANDIDIYSFELKKDGFSKMTFTHDASGDSSVYFKVSLYKITGEKTVQKLTTIEVKGDKATTESSVIATSADKYIIRVDAGASCAPIEYTVKVTSEAVSYKSETEKNDDASSANALTPNYTKTIGKELVYGSVTATDKDYFTFTLAERGYISLNLFNGKKFGAANSDFTFKIAQYSNDVSPILLKISEYKLTAGEDTAYTPDVGLAAGTYFIEATGTGIYGVEVYAVKDATSELEYNNAMAYANVLTNSNSYVAAMNREDDRDLFKVDVTDKVASKITVAPVSSTFDGDLSVKIYKKTTASDPIVTGKVSKDTPYEYDLGKNGAGVYYIAIEKGATCPTKLYKISAVKSEVTKVGNDGDGMWARIWAQVKTMDWSQFAVYKELIGNIDMKTVMGYFTGTFLPIVQRLVKWFQENR